MTINDKSLQHALSQLFQTTIIDADCQSTPLQGGTVGNVQLLTGHAVTADGEKRPYRIVRKTQKKWERYGDPQSWRREYDLYATDLGSTFASSFRWPQCYHAEMNAEEDAFELWMEYVDGVTGLDLAGDMYEQAALELGRYQGRLYAEQPAVLRSLANLSHADLMKNTYLHYRSWPLVYDYVRSEDCAFPQPVSQMFIDIDTHADEILARIERLPLVLCHRDFWVTNLIYKDGSFAVIDWDTSGWGRMGEDIASLIADEADIDHMVDYYKRCVPAYYRGFAEYAEAPPLSEQCVYELILLMFGYRLVEWYLHAEDEETKAEHLHTLQKIHEMKHIAFGALV